MIWAVLHRPGGILEYAVPLIREWVVGLWKDANEQSRRRKPHSVVGEDQVTGGNLSGTAARAGTPIDVAPTAPTWIGRRDVDRLRFGGRCFRAWLGAGVVGQHDVASAPPLVTLRRDGQL